MEKRDARKGQVTREEKEKEKDVSFGFSEYRAKPWEPKGGRYEKKENKRKKGGGNGCAKDTGRKG